VFVSVLFLHGPAKYLFTPLGLAVVFAMLASYALSRTLTPITIGLLLKGEHHGHDGHAPRGVFARLHARFERGFENLRHGYSDVLTTLLTRRLIVPVVAVAMLTLGGTLYFYVGRDFFPAIDGGQIQLHVRGPAGTRIEKTELMFQAIEDKIREVIPDNEREQILDNIGLPARNYNLAFSDGTTIGVNDGVILVTLKEGHPPTAGYVHKLREVLPATFPEATFYFQAADMVTQILNFGIPAQIDVRTVGYDRANNLAVARELKQKLAAIPGIADAHVQQEVDAPEFYAVIDRARAAQFGLTANSVATNLNVSLSSSVQVSPNFWTDPSTGTPYFLAVQTPEHRISSLEDLQNTPVGSVTAPNGNPVPQMLENVATLTRDSIATNANHANIQPVYEVYANVENTDLGTVSTAIDKMVAEVGKKLKPGNRIEVLGQIESMNNAFQDMGLGLLFASVFVYLLMVVNYQNFMDPFVVILALPATFCGIVTMLFITGTTLNVPSLMGAIMAIGVASANSILLVTFAREQQLAGMKAFDAAQLAGRTRIRPVLMTAAAMIVGMLPMAIGGAGEEQNAALARAVIGGLLFATPTTLLIVPYLFALLRKGNDGNVNHGVFSEESL
jgi:multidrug efflux pump subunit AcrB